jgi:hypothetical protein
MRTVRTILACSFGAISQSRLSRSPDIGILRLLFANGPHLGTQCGLCFCVSKPLHTSHVHSATSIDVCVSYARYIWAGTHLKQQLMRGTASASSCTLLPHKPRPDGLAQAWTTSGPGQKPSEASCMAQLSLAQEGLACPGSRPEAGPCPSLDLPYQTHHKDLIIIAPAGIGFGIEEEDVL